MNAMRKMADMSRDELIENFEMAHKVLEMIEQETGIKIRSNRHH